MKTAIEKMIEKWYSELGSYITNAPIYKAFIEEAKTYLETEKQQIIDAYNSGFKNAMESESKSNYYDETYKTNKETLK